MQKPSGAFFDTLGQYVYAYIDEDGDWIYCGKGNGDRCWAHVVEKGLDPEDIYIIARNLDDFAMDKKDCQSFLLESYLIATHKPKRNKVSGHYKENFEMATLKGLFKTYSNAQRDMHVELGEFIRRNEEVLKGTIGMTESRGVQFTLKSGAIENAVFGIKVSSKHPEFTCFIESNGTQEHFNQLRADIKERLGEEYNVEDATTKSVSWTVEDEETAIGFWSDFHSDEEE